MYPGDTKKRARPESPFFKANDPKIKPRPANILKPVFKYEPLMKPSLNDMEKWIETGKEE